MNQTMKQKFTDILHFRNACKLFNDSKVSKEDLIYILEAGRMSPSSFGVEPWKFLVIQNEQSKQKLQEASYNQTQVGTASAIVVILARKDMKLEQSYAEKMLRRSGDDLYESFLKDFYTGYTANMDAESLGNWSDKQCQLAAMNMMNAAAVLGIDSCPIGGFVPNLVNDLLEIDQNKYQISMLLPLGYRANEPYAKIRNDFNDVVEYLD